MSASSVVFILPPGLGLFPESVSEALVLVFQDGVDLAVLLAIFIVLSEWLARFDRWCPAAFVDAESVAISTSVIPSLLATGVLGTSAVAAWDCVNSEIDNEGFFITSKDLQCFSAFILLRHGLWSSVSRFLFFPLVCDECCAGWLCCGPPLLIWLGTSLKACCVLVSCSCRMLGRPNVNGSNVLLLTWFSLSVRTD